MSSRILTVTAMVLLAGASACSSSSSYNDASTGGAAGNGGGGGGGPGGTCHAAGTLNVVNNGASAYVIDGASNPDLTFCRLTTYLFNVNAPGHPFYIKTVQSTGTGNAFDEGVTGNGAETGTVAFIVPTDAPATLYYDCSIHAAMTGTIHVVD